MEHPTSGLMADYVSATRAAKELQVSSFTLRRWRYAGYGPMPVRVGGRLRYRLSDIESWLASLGTANAKAGAR